MENIVGMRIYKDDKYFVEAQYQDDKDAFLVLVGVRSGSGTHCHFTIKEDGTVINERHRGICEECGQQSPSKADCVELLKQAIRERRL